MCNKNIYQYNTYIHYLVWSKHLKDLVIQDNCSRPLYLCPILFRYSPFIVDHQRTEIHVHVCKCCKNVDWLTFFSPSNFSNRSARKIQTIVYYDVIANFRKVYGWAKTLLYCLPCPLLRLKLMQYAILALAY